jgi:hypothetical protein
MLMSPVGLKTSEKQRWRCPAKTENLQTRLLVRKGAPHQQTRNCLKKTKTPWSESVIELYRPSDRRLSAKRLPTCADRGCHVVSVTDPSGRILSVFKTGAATFLSSSSSVVVTRLSGPRSRPTTLFFFW